MSDNEKENELQVILHKLDAIGADVFVNVQSMLDSFEKKVIAKMDAHLARYELRMKERDEKYADTLARHERLLASHEATMHALEGKTEAVKRQVGDITKFQPTIKSRWFICGGLVLIFLMVVDTLALLSVVRLYLLKYGP